MIVRCIFFIFLHTNSIFIIMHRKAILSIILLGLLLPVFSYGPIAHRAISLIAYEELTPEARRQVDMILGVKGIVYESTWADEIRSEPEKYSYSYPWHYQNLAPGMTSDDLLKMWNNPRSEGDHLFYAMQEMMNRLKKNKKDAEALKFLIHFTGDLHQPMHLGRKEDLGGNRVPFTWFGRQTNIHSLWDTFLVEHKKMSFTELAEYLCLTQVSNKAEFKNMTLPEVIQKSYAITNRIYEYNRDETNNYIYVYHFNKDLDEMMYLGGIQLAKILNEIYQ